MSARTNPYQSPNPYYPYDGTKILNYEAKIRSLEEYIRQLENENTAIDISIIILFVALSVITFFIGTLVNNC